MGSHVAFSAAAAAAAGRGLRLLFTSADTDRPPYIPLGALKWLGTMVTCLGSNTQQPPTTSLHPPCQAVNGSRQNAGRPLLSTGPATTLYAAGSTYPAAHCSPGWLPTLGKRNQRAGLGGTLELVQYNSSSSTLVNLQSSTEAEPTARKAEGNLPRRAPHTVRRWLGGGSTWH